MVKRRIGAQNQISALSCECEARAAGLSGTPRRVLAGLMLLALVAGFLTASADALLHHVEHYAEIPAPACDAGAPLSHLVREQTLLKVPPCSACFLRSLVAHSLVPQTYQYAPVIPSAPLHIEHRTSASRFLCSSEVNRGPPSIASIAS